MNRFRVWLAAQQHPAAVTDSTGQLLEGNARLFGLFPLPSAADEPLPLLQSLLFPSESVDESAATRHGIVELLSQAQRSVSAEFSVAIDVLRILDVTVFPQLDENCEPAFWLWVIRDASDGHRLREHREHSERMRTIGRFAGGMAHEFNNLLTVILGNLELLRASPELTVRDVLPYVESAEVASLRASQLIHELRTFASREVTHCEVQSIAPVVRKVRRLLAGIAPDRIRVSHEFGCTAEPFASVNAARLEDALLKVGLNAIETIDKDDGSVHLKLFTSTSDEAGATVSICVTAAGVRVSDSSIESSFEPFSATPDMPNLGMAIAYGLLEEMGGRVTSSNIGRHRSCVILTLPACERPDVITVEADSDFTQSPRTLSIAVIDSESSVRKVARGMLRLLGHQPTSFACGLKFLEAVDQGWEFDLVLLDNAMPKISGRTTYERFRGTNTATPVIICSGRTIDLQAFSPAVDQRPHGFLSKPFSIADLSAAVAPHA